MIIFIVLKVQIILFDINCFSFQFAWNLSFKYTIQRRNKMVQIFFLDN